MKAVLDHIGIAVSDLPASLAFFRDTLGLHLEASEEIATQKVRAHFLSTGRPSLEMHEATAADSPIAKYLDKRGPGIHHLALQAYGEGEWRPPILKTEATTGHGVAELWATVQQFRTYSENVASGFSRTHRTRRLKARNEFRLRDLLTHRFMELVEHEVLGAGEFDALVARIAAREVDPYTAASDILSRALRPKS